MASAAKTLYLVDAMALAYRSFFAFNRTMLSTSQGIPTGAIYGTAMFLNKLIAERKPDYLVAVTDLPGPTFRDEIFPEYKATRDKQPDELSQQLPHVLELFSRFHCRLASHAGIEADDLIATMAKAWAGPGLDAFIVSGDKDFYQLVGDHIFVLAPKKNEEMLLVDRAGVHERFGCAPEQMIDIQALIGDTVDNVPGVAGIGEKGAAALVAKYGSLEKIYASLDDITAKRQREGLIASKDDAFLSRRLVTLKVDAPVDFKLEDLKVDWHDAMANPDLLEFYERFEFKSLVTKVKASLGKRGVGPLPTAASAAGGEVAGVATAPTVLEAIAAEIVTSDTIKALTEKLAAAPEVGVAVIADGKDLVASKAVAVALAFSDGKASLFRLDQEGIYLARPVLGALLKSVKVGHAMKTAFQALRNVGIDLAGPMIDVEIVDYLLDPNNYDHSLDGICARYAPDARGASLAESDPAAQAQAALAVWKATRARVESEGLLPVLETVEMPLVGVLAEMEQEGFFVDSSFLATYSDELSAASKDVEKRLYEAAGTAFNINSPKQLQELLFEKLRLQEGSGIKRMKKTKTGLSTDESVLARLAATHPVPKLILEYRSLTKLKNTYVDPLPQYVHSLTGRVHSSLRQTVAATGRLSSDKPNLQNIPMRTPMGRKIRNAFQAQAKDAQLISADYSQVELRLLAHLANATEMIEAFKRGLDVHTVTAARVFGVPEDKVDKVMRSRAKAINFGIIYGMGPMRLAEETGVTLTEAKSFIAKYFDAYPGIRAYTRSLVELARERGYCTTILGRRRPIPEIREANQAVRARGENIAVNAPIQGSAADLIKLAMIRVAAALHDHRMRTRLLLQVHDELVFEAPAKEVEEAVPLIREAMEHAIVTSVPLKVDIHVGHTWLEAK